MSGEVARESSEREIWEEEGEELTKPRQVDDSSTSTGFPLQANCSCSLSGSKRRGSLRSIEGLLIEKKEDE